MVSNGEKVSKICFIKMTTFNKILLVLHHHEDAASKLQKIDYKTFFGQRVKAILFDIRVEKALSCKAMTKFYCKECIATMGKIPRGE